MGSCCLHVCACVTDGPGVLVTACVDSTSSQRMQPKEVILRRSSPTSKPSPAPSGNTSPQSALNASESPRRPSLKSKPPSLSTPSERSLRHSTATNSRSWKNLLVLHPSSQPDQQKLHKLRKTSIQESFVGSLVGRPSSPSLGRNEDTNGEGDLEGLENRGTRGEGCLGTDRLFRAAHAGTLCWRRRRRR